NVGSRASGARLGSPLADRLRREAAAVLPGQSPPSALGPLPGPVGSVALVRMPGAVLLWRGALRPARRPLRRQRRLQRGPVLGRRRRQRPCAEPAPPGGRGGLRLLQRPLRVAPPAGVWPRGARGGGLRRNGCVRLDAGEALPPVPV